MKRRTIFGLVTAGALGLVAAGGAVAYGAHGGRHGMVKRMVAAAIDDALDQAQVTPEQRTAINRIRDRAFASLEQTRTSHRAHLEDGLRLFEAAEVDPAQVESFHRQVDEERKRMRDTIHEALVEAHAILTPTQRRTVADYVRQHQMSHMH